VGMFCDVVLFKAPPVNIRYQARRQALLEGRRAKLETPRGYIKKLQIQWKQLHWSRICLWNKARKASFSHVFCKFL